MNTFAHKVAVAAAWFISKIPSFRWDAKHMQMSDEEIRDFVRSVQNQGHSSHEIRRIIRRRLGLYTGDVLVGHMTHGTTVEQYVTIYIPGRQNDNITVTTKLRTPCRMFVRT